MAHANRTYGEQIFDVNEWRVVGEYVHDSQGGRHQTFVSPVREVTVLGSVIKPPERIQFEQSLKYSKTDADSLWKSAELVEDAVWSRDGEYGTFATIADIVHANINEMNTRHLSAQKGISSFSI